MTSINDFIKSGKTFVSFKNDPVHEFLLEKMEVVPNELGEGETVRYYVVEDEVNRTFTSSKVSFAEVMQGFIGKRIRVTREGSGPKTDYKVEELA